MGFYAVALLLPDKIENELDRLRGEYSKYVRYITYPHVTLEYPFQIEVDQRTIIDRLAVVARNTSPFTLMLRGIEYFEGDNNVAYIGIANKQPVIELRTDIVSHLGGMIEVEEQYKEIDLPEKFIPHLTIGEGIPNKIFADFKKRMTDYKIDHEVEVKSFALFFKDEGGIWKPTQVFELFRR
jgi:2'-5' RNA ligase